MFLLNRVTEVINFWQEGQDNPGGAYTVEDAKAMFPDCSFMGHVTPTPPAAAAAAQLPVSQDGGVVAPAMA